MVICCYQLWSFSPWITLLTINIYKLLWITINYIFPMNHILSRADGSFVKLLSRLQRISLLIIDDWGINPFTDDERRNFLEIMEDRHNVRSTIIASQFPVDTWHVIIGEPILADAICDRIVHNAHKIILKGEDSMRKIYSILT